MPKVISVGVGTPPHKLLQEETLQFAREMFSSSFSDIERLLKVFQNGDIKTRYFAQPLDWYKENHTFEEKNEAFIHNAIKFGINAIKDCIRENEFLEKTVLVEEIDAIFFISTTGLSTPSIEARIMNKLPFSLHTKRIPVWGLGCAGGASGLSRAYEYCLAYPKAKVLLLSVELCSLTFQRDDQSKSNLVGTSLFSDGVACVLLAGDEATGIHSKKKRLPSIKGVESTLMPNSEDVMGWDIRNNGLYVVFSRDIPSIVRSWLGDQVKEFLKKYSLTEQHIKHFVAHPGGKKVLKAYRETLNFSEEMTETSSHVLQSFGNMSSATVLYVLKEFLQQEITEQDYGIVTALGPGFSSELLLLKWEG
ncbi:type III polyketide synthase [Priestia endophytica]|uniref:Type III polyketide synthase n=1 Tax=Priestia endophytica TaxID=135735 RepID=A0AAX1Q251_9BACI|nr:3-oxoacyl-[acyl-carrier-protein] synthase III C-terminal domain-containing protein [Priestia endophytica]RAS71977.1 type III polyketide synthase [Priestia endophytica]RAS89594.1 type III polyketide synthase [Priestia endophytica]